MFQEKEIVDSAQEEGKKIFIKFKICMSLVPAIPLL